jgi:hypothetical protein
MDTAKFHRYRPKHLSKPKRRVTRTAAFTLVAMLGVAIGSASTLGGANATDREVLAISAPAPTATSVPDASPLSIEWLPEDTGAEIALLGEFVEAKPTKTKAQRKNKGKKKGADAPKDTNLSQVAAPAPTAAPAQVVAPPTIQVPATTAAPATTAPPPPPPPPPPPEPTVAPPAAGGPSEAQWAALRQCESGGNYSIVSANGTYRGAYQFSTSTWNNVASQAYPSLVGMDPAAATPYNQDSMAKALYGMSGASPWPHCGRHLY